MKKITTLTAAVLMSVALVPAAIAGEREQNIAAFKAAGYILINEDCADKQLIIELECFASDNPVVMRPGNEYIARTSYREILKANPGIENYLVNDNLPPKHWIATREKTLEISNLE